MSLNGVPSSERLHIGIFGKRNAGKSSVINAITGQDLAVVSDVKGTTTDPVQKAMELLPLGPVVIIDTPGIDDSGELGGMRVKKAKRTLEKTDVALIIVDAEVGVSDDDRELIREIEKRGIPYALVINKSDLADCPAPTDIANVISVSAATGENIYELKELIAKIAPSERIKPPIVADLIDAGDFVVLVVPIDSAAPKGRLILPQQQTLREILDCNATAIVCQPSELAASISELKSKPRLVITDSQAFAEVSKIVPEDITLTSFSILMARHKGRLAPTIEGVHALDSVKAGDRILICEGCTHHRQCDDIGTVKLPRLIRRYTGCDDLTFEFTSGTGFPEDLSGYKMIVHCGGCMLNDREMMYRIETAEAAGVPITNYGIAISYMNGILERSIRVFNGMFE